MTNIDPLQFRNYVNIIGTAAAFLLANTATWMNLPSLLTWKTYFVCYFAGSVALISFWSLQYYVWVYILILPYPVPLIGVTTCIAGILAIIVQIWFKFPLSWRQDSSFKQRAKYLSVAQLFILVLNVEYAFYSWAFYAIPREYQWILAILVPLTREIGAMFLTEVCDKTAGRKDVTGELVAAHLGLNHCRLLPIHV